MLLFVVPIFEDMFADLGGELPLPTQILVTLSGAMKFVAPVGGRARHRVRVLVAPAQATTSGVRNVVDPLKLKLPVFGKLFAKIALARFSRNLSTLLRSGVPILASLEIVSDTTGSVVISRALDDVRKSVAQGDSIAGPLAKHEVFPPMVVQMIASGEETGAVDEMLRADRRVLRRGGRGHHRGPHLAHRAADDRLPRRRRRRHDRRPLPADLQGLRPDPVSAATVPMTTT